MNISEIKATIGVATLPFVRCTQPVIDPATNAEVIGADGKPVMEPTVWLRAWFNHIRVAVVVHEELIPEIPTAINLALKTSLEVGKDTGTPYKQHILIGFKDDAEVTF